MSWSSKVRLILYNVSISVSLCVMKIKHTHISHLAKGWEIRTDLCCITDNYITAPSPKGFMQVSRSIHIMSLSTSTTPQRKACHFWCLKTKQTLCPQHDLTGTGTLVGRQVKKREMQTNQPVSLRSSRKFWDRCFSALRLYSLISSPTVGSGGMRKDAAFLEAAIVPVNTLENKHKSWEVWLPTTAAEQFKTSTWRLCGHVGH